jgi:hypothetical protein
MDALSIRWYAILICSLRMAILIDLENIIPLSD